MNYSLGTVNDFHWMFKPILSYSKPHTFSTIDHRAFIFHMLFGVGKDKNPIDLGSLGQRSRWNGSLLLKK